MVKLSDNATQPYPNNTVRQGERCGAKTRSGRPCPTWAMPNGRCRMHGGTNPGAPKGNKNAWKHGLRSTEFVERRRLIRTLMQEALSIDELELFAEAVRNA